MLEPGCGPGIFLGLAPPGAELVGVELDPTHRADRAGAVSRTRTSARSRSRATRLPDGYFDLAIGNVPFADVRLHDPRHNPAGHSLHNHFILKSLALTRPGGLVAVLTSHYTLDAANPAARREMNALGGPGRRGQAADRRAPPSGRHRRADGPADPPPPPTRRARARHELGDDPPGRRRRPGGADQQLPGRAPGAGARRADGRDRGCTAQTRCTSARTAASTTHPRSSPTRSASSSTARASTALLAGPRNTSHLAAAADDRSRPTQLAPEGAWDGHIAALTDGSFSVTSDGLSRAAEGPCVPPRRAARAARPARHRARAARRRGLDARGHRRDRRAARAAQGPLRRLPAPVRADQPVHAAAHRPHRPRQR